MEQLLWLYLQPYDSEYPVVCFDERPCFLIGEEIAARPMQKGEVRKEHYTYKKNGCCTLLAAIEPLTGKRVAQVHRQRTKKEFTQFCQALAGAYPQAKKIRLILDNLSTHNLSAFYEHLPAAEAFALAQRFEFHFTPKCGSWLNLIEVEFSAVARQCLSRRIPTQEQLAREVLKCIQERAEKKIPIGWQFSLEKARTKLNSHYERARQSNTDREELKET
jgi:transposase